MINKLFNSKDISVIPKWFLRQAGRHIPEYYTIRNKYNNFIDFCFDEESIINATILPLKYYNIDAAILFSDILLLPHSLGQEVIFKKGKGPLLSQIDFNKHFFNKQINFNNLRSIKNAISKIKKIISPKQDLIGFCGAPWTLACYMIEGGTSKDFALTRNFCGITKVCFLI